MGLNQLPEDFESEQIWLDSLKSSFDSLPQLHEGVQWTDVEKSLKADPESMREIQAFNEKGHAINVLGEEDDEFIFTSAWKEYEQVAEDHRNITYDDAVSIIAKIMGVEEDEAGNYLADKALHEKLIRAMAINGWSWLKKDATTAGKEGFGFFGSGGGTYGYFASNHAGTGAGGSFRIVVRVKKV